MLNHISDTGISVAYEAENSQPIVDIVFVHGLQGHPSKTWTYRPKKPDTSEPSANASGKKVRRSAIGRVAAHLRRKLSKAVPTSSTELSSATLHNGEDTQLKPVFWPADLLPKECPDSRILVFGYDSKITKYAAGAINQNSILSHSKDLLFALCRERDLNRSLVFVAHSLGGIVVKEMLARSSSSPKAELRNIVESTASIIFLGTPHRGSQDVAALGEVVRSVISSFGMETTPVILDALGLKTTDLERAQEDFSKAWLKYDLQVKTFQEGLSLAKLGKKVVPDYSSLFGDHREQAETLQANHIEMCRYSGTNDPNYRKVVGELRSLYRSIAKLKTVEARLIQQKRRHPGSACSAVSPKEPGHIANGGNINESCLGSLWFPAINTRYQSLGRPARDTCSWLFNHKLYQDWFGSWNREESYGLLWLKGKPGAGKSTLMKEALRRATLGNVEPKYRTAAFFFSAKGDELEHSSLGLFRSLLYQLLPRDERHLQRFQETWNEKRRSLRGNIEANMVFWAESELMAFFESMMTDQTRKRTMIFIDGLDECDEHTVRSMAYFWREITMRAYHEGVDLKVCLSSRHFPTVTLSDCPEIIVDQHNGDDIATYVDHRLQVGSIQEEGWEYLKKTILGKSDGVFLWVVLVVEDLLKHSDDGKGMVYLRRRVLDVPEQLHDLFSDLFLNLEPKTKELTIKFFQWAVLATKPLRLHEWHHIMAFIRQPELRSLREWRQSVDFIESDEQLEKQIRSISKGLVEVKKVGTDDSQDDGLEVISIGAGAGSLNLEHGDTRIVQVIHESVRDFFLAGKGFTMINSHFEDNPIGNGHFIIVATCLDYLYIQELDALVEARIQAAMHKTSQERLRSATVSLSNDKSHARYEDVVPGKQNQPSQGKNSASGGEKTSVFEILAPLDDTSGIDIIDWMTRKDFFCAGTTYSNDSRRKSAATSSDASQPRLLEDYPALLSYATAELFTHIQLAEKYGSDPQYFLTLLKEDATWTRWVALREDIPNGTKLVSYLDDMGLWPWMKPCFDDTTPYDSDKGIRSFYKEPRFNEPQNVIMTEPQSVVINEVPSISISIQADHRKSRRHRRSQSVASFSSAGSHGI
ncbi:hypothetical protein V8C42DRAFT_167980 [Trichoderma barbatum]